MTTTQDDPTQSRQWCPGAGKPWDIKPGDDVMIAERVNSIYAGFRAKVLRVNGYGSVVAVDDGKGHTVELQFQEWALEKL